MNKNKKNTKLQKKYIFNPFRKYQQYPKISDQALKELKMQKY